MRVDQHVVLTPKRIPTERFRDAEAALARLELIYDTHTAFLRDQFARLLKTGTLPGRVRATYPEVRIETSTYAQIDSRLAYGHVAGPGVYSTTVTRPALFRGYLARTDPPAHPQPRRAGRDRPVGRADPAALRLSRRHPRRGRDRRPHPSTSGRSATCSTCPISRSWTMPSSTARYRAAPGAPMPLAPVHARRGSTTRCTACRTTPRRCRSISRTSSSSPTTSSTSTSSHQTRRDDGGRRPRLRQPSSSPATWSRPARFGRAGQRGTTPERLPQMPAYPPDARRATRASPWSISASGRPTPRPSPTTSRCSGRMPG